MWFLPTRGRPDACQKLIAAMMAVGDCPKVAVMIDDDPSKYRSVKWPEHWEIHHAPGHLELTLSLNLLMQRYPDCQFYGFFGDHFRPRSKWSAALEAAAGDWFISWPQDNVYSDKQVSAAPCFGGKLIRALGWICLPTTIHLCTDRPWWFLWKELGIGKCVDGALCTHDRPEITKRPKDANHNRVYHGLNYPPHDLAAWQKWERTESRSVLVRLRQMMTGDGYAFGSNGLLDAKYGTTPFKAGW